MEGSLGRWHGILFHRHPLRIPMTHYHPCDDVPIVHSDQDKLNRSRLASRLLEAIKFAPLPQVMGVEGDWGSGKTSLLQNLFWRIEKKVPRQTATLSGPGNLQIPQKKALTETKWKERFSRTDQGSSDEFLTDENIRAVWFEAWRYQHEPEPVIALLHEIRSQLLTGDKWEQRAKKLWETMKHGAEVFVKGLFASTNEIISSIQAEVELPLVGKISAQMADVGKHVRAAGDARQARLMAEPLKSEMLHKNLDLAISLFLGDEKEEGGKGEENRKRRLVIIIDDLDRCTSDA
ncbi:MAG TPA: P-loop NTPase fold protein, partial [Prosthecobacter sp.]